MDPYLLIILLFIFYFFLLRLLKTMGVWRKKIDASWVNCCPSCNLSLERKKRKKSDHILNYFTFNIFTFKRYSCRKCNWEGLLWDNPIEK